MWPPAPRQRPTCEHQLHEVVLEAQRMNEKNEADHCSAPNAHHCCKGYDTKKAASFGTCKNAGKFKL
ncbi:unnamed protein product [Amoebophrya sp. A120]|nr:unnamed protein product [Amoebophrya sp. A120]|eukprot:GSA120T00026068001.1